MRQTSTVKRAATKTAKPKNRLESPWPKRLTLMRIFTARSRRQRISYLLNAVERMVLTSRIGWRQSKLSGAHK